MKPLKLILLIAFAASFIGCKKDECRQKNYENENCYRWVECYNLSSETITQKLIGKWKVTQFVKDGKSIKKYVGDKLEFCCEEVLNGICVNGQLKLKMNLLKKHKTSWIYKGWSLHIGQNDKFPLEYSSLTTIHKLTRDELVVHGYSIVTLKKLK